MQSGNLWRILGLCLLSVGAWGQEETEDAVGESTGSPPEKEYKVSISGTTVVLTCPEEVEAENLKWEKDGKEIPQANEKQLSLDEFSEVEHSGYYACYTDLSKKNYLYLKARVCRNCMEVDLMAVVAIIIVDICITLGLMLIVYHCSKNRKANAMPVMRATGAGGRTRGQNKEKPPPVPNPDYEPIRKGQHDLYSGLNQRGI
ncbi:T-cell surface glycoprotein CD3 epsilon chain [Callorhinus ursinus]|uniref:T-cell surface glycoprotein CD3 epsilon chain n=1 Tax=Callorhinus ursinus TaxID=34884 RepID=A0A3Q7R419_CALUR|nr:T-cell surface glycoprotein CD3 epsilon chain [Callorhinus ursinus]XP_025749247.1 T-cell surface glycoprotein CD3 epsilon chain [Callorhinus ursinus]